MNEVVLIRCLDEWMVFYCPVAVRSIPGGVMFLSPFFDLFLVTILGRFWDPAGSPKSTKIRLFAKKDVPGSSFLTIFAARAFFLELFHRFSFDFSLKIDVFSSVVSLLIACFF